MRELVLAAATLAALGVGISIDRAEAMTVFPGGLRPAIDTINSAEQVALCRRYGWRGRDWYRCGRHVGRSSYAPRANSWHRPSRYSYRWRHHHWR